MLASFRKTQKPSVPKLGPEPELVVHSEATQDSQYYLLGRFALHSKLRFDIQSAEIYLHRYLLLEGVFGQSSRAEPALQCFMVKNLT